MAASGSGSLGRGFDISLAALKQQDPYIRGIVDVASQVALYTFSHVANEWEKTDVEGTLFVYTRSASPKHGFTIMNRLSMENRTEPITKDLDFQLQDPFLLYRNARFCIYGIWFYDKEECRRLAELMKNLTQQEQLKAQQGGPTGLSPMTLNSADGKEVDILQMLTKAKDEYTKCKPSSEPKMMSSSSAIYSNPNLIKPIAVKPSDPTQPPGKFGDPEPQHLSLTALFGKPDKGQEAEPAEPTVVRPPVVRSLSYEEPSQSRVAENSETQLCPAIQKLMVRGHSLHPVSEIPENRQCHNGTFQGAGSILSDLFQPVAPGASFSIKDHEGGESLLHKLHGTHVTLPQMDLGPPAPSYSFAPSHSFCGLGSSVAAKDAGPSTVAYYDGCLQSQRTSAPAPQLPLSSQPNAASGAISPQELLKKLNLVRQEQQLHSSPRPALAAKFPVVTQSGAKTPWVEKFPGTEKHNTLFQVISPQRIPATVSPALLMSPLVFTQSSVQSRPSDATKAPASKEPSNGTPGLLLPPVPPDAPACSSSAGNQISILTKSQLKGTLLHLIQNDDSFLNTIYETYLSTLARGGSVGRKI